MTTETMSELAECLKLALKNFQHDTLPRPEQIKRMREAVAAAESEIGEQSEPVSLPGLAQRSVLDQAQADINRARHVDNVSAFRLQLRQKELESEPRNKERQMSMMITTKPK